MDSWRSSLFCSFVQILGVVLLNIGLYTCQSRTVTETWTAPQSQKIIPLTEVRRDCAGGAIVDVRFVDGLNLTASPSCDTRERDMYAGHLSWLFNVCYANTSCDKIHWNRDGFGAYNGCQNCNHTHCTNHTLQGLVTPKLTVVCLAIHNTTSWLTVTNVTNTPKGYTLQVYRTLCSDGEFPTVQHVFRISHCSKPMVPDESEQNELKQLVSAIQECITTNCKQVAITPLFLSTSSCIQISEPHTRVGIHWRCNTEATNHSSWIGAHTGTAKDCHNTAINDFYGPFVAILVLLIIAVCVIIGLTIVIVRKERLQRRLTIAKPVKPPPSRQSLYTTLQRAMRFSKKEDRDRKSRNSDRYTTTPAKGAHSRTDDRVQPPSEYETPMLEQPQTPTYSNVDDTYEEVKPQQFRDHNTIGGGYLIPRTSQSFT